MSGRSSFEGLALRSAANSLTMVHIPVQHHDLQGPARGVSSSGLLKQGKWALLQLAGATAGVAFISCTHGADTQHRLSGASGCWGKIEGHCCACCWNLLNRC